MKFADSSKEAMESGDRALDMIVGMEVSTSSMFKALVEKSDDILLITTNDLVIKYITGSVERLLGHRPEETVGLKLIDLVDETLVERFKQYIDLDEVTESTYTEVALNAKSGEEKFFDVTTTNLLSNDRVNGLVIKLHDITDRKLTEKKLLKANNELDHFIYKTSHDLRAPLLSALGLVELAEKDPEKDQYQYLSLIRQSLVKLDNFIEDINSFYRNEKLAVRRERINFKKMIGEEIDSLKSISDDYKRIDIKHNIAQVSEMYSDSLRLKTVITNILSNAIKYSDMQKSSPFINLSIQVTPDTCIIRVSDNGIGIRQKYLDNIFDIFYRADENAKGSGLGLYIVKDTIDKLNGQIKVESEYGKGSAFTITVPNFLN